MSLNNFYKHKQVKEQQEQEQQKQLKQQKYEHNRKIHSVQLKARADHRVDNFQETMMSQQFVDCMKNGTYPLLPVTKHSFRDRHKKAEMDETGGIYLKTFQVAADRANTAAQNYKEGHLKEDFFNANQPHKNHAHWLRVDDVTKESKSMRFGLGDRTEVGRVNSKVEKTQGLVDFEERNMKMSHFPDWKDVHKEQWVGEKTFNIYPCMQQANRTSPPWQEFPLNLNNQNNQYIDGFEVTGDLSRKRFKKKEGKRSEFIASVKEDMVGTTIHISKSNRTMKADLALNIPTNYDQYSTNPQIQFYKSTLLQTKSVDHLTPHEHSNNYKGLTFKNIRPNAPCKLYKLSVNVNQKHYITKQPPNSAEMKTTAKTDAFAIVEPVVAKLTNIQELSQAGVQTQSVPQSRDTVRSKFFDMYTTKNSKDKEMKLGYPYHQEDDETTKKIMGQYFQQ